VVVLVTTTLITSINMAQCKNCGAKVGCSCQLTNGLCAYCNKAVQQAVKTSKYVAAKLN
jgi:hypothetical protein